MVTEKILVAAITEKILVVVVTENIELHGM